MFLLVYLRDPYLALCYYECFINIHNKTHYFYVLYAMHLMWMLQQSSLNLVVERLMCCRFLFFSISANKTNNDILI